MGYKVLVGLLWLVGFMEDTGFGCGVGDYGTMYYVACDCVGMGMVRIR